MRRSFTRPLRTVKPPVTHVPLLGAVAMAGVALGAGLAEASSLASTATARDVVLVAAGLLFLIFLSAVPRLAAQDWFHPFAFPLTYLAFALTVPVGYIVLTHRPLYSTLNPFSISVTLIATLALCLAGLAAGSAVGLRLAPRGQRETETRYVNQQSLRAVGRGLLLVALVLRGYSVVKGGARPYGSGALVYDAATALDTASVQAIFTGVALVTLGSVRSHRGLGTWLDRGLFGGYVLLTVSVGSRGELIAPIVFAMWVRHTYVRRIRFGPASAVALTVAVVLQGVGGVRANGPFIGSGTSAVERTLGSVGTPVQVTDLVIQHVPSDSPFRHGSTYLAALERQLPGPIARSVLGPPNEAGTAVLRSLIGFTNPNAGFAFALPAEGYLNGGLLGSLGAGLTVGLLLGYAYRRVPRATLPTHGVHVLYPILVATIALSVRADALSEVKGVLYPMLAIAAAYRLAAVRFPAATRFAARQLPVDSLDSLAPRQTERTARQTSAAPS